MDDKKRVTQWLDEAKQRLHDARARRHRQHKANRETAEYEHAIESAAIESKMSGWFEDEIMTLDQCLAEMERDHSASAQMQSLIAAAKQRRNSAEAASSSARPEAIDRYYEAVQDVLDARRQLL
jgi:hypothetical protein